MVKIITFENRRQFTRQLLSMFEDRKRVFVELFKWKVPVIEGRFEIDQFDDHAATYLLISDHNGGHLGSLRLLRTDRPHILGSLFPHLSECDVPTGRDTLEISRLCLSRRMPAGERLRLRNELISGMTDHALATGITSLTGVVRTSFLSQILSMGWRCEPLGRPHQVDGSMIGAFRIHVDEATPQALDRTGIYLPGTIAGFGEHGCAAA